MGFLGFGDDKKKEQEQEQQQQVQITADNIWNIPDEQLNFYQRNWKKWKSMYPFVTEDGYQYDKQNKAAIDSRLHSHFACSNIDNLLEMKAPKFYLYFYTLCDNVAKLCKYVKNNIQSNNDYQKLLGENEALKRQCEQQEALIRELTINRSENMENIHTPTDHTFSR